MVLLSKPCPFLRWTIKEKNAPTLPCLNLFMTMPCCQNLQLFYPQSSFDTPCCRHRATGLSFVLVYSTYAMVTHTITCIFDICRCRAAGGRLAL